LFSYIILELLYLVLESLILFINILLPSSTVASNSTALAVPIPFILVSISLLVFFLAFSSLTFSQPKVEEIKLTGHLQEKVTIDKEETTGELWDKLSKIGAKLLVETIIQQNESVQRFQSQLEEREKEINSQNEELIKTKKALYTDSLTQVPNRNKYEIDFDTFIKAFKEEGTLFSYSILDIDFFKKINDTFGHKI
jgi:predicted signal transduction protein with EAL and GGDEF domain